MKRILLMLGLGFVIINVTNGCNKSSDNTTSTTPPAMTTTTNATTNAVPPATH